MAEITRDDENAAFDKLRSKIERIPPQNRRADLVVMPKMTLAEWDAIFQFYRRHA